MPDEAFPPPRPALAISLAALLACPPAPAQGPAWGPPRPDDERLAWWREARFGMFIHWGLYAIPAGEWQGRPVGGIGEWIQHIARIPEEEYETLVGRFNPVKFDADEWARIARDAGMRYLVITTKHHDGFALFDSAVSDYDVMATPFARDIMKEISDACRLQSLRVGWYHSILDWHHPDYLPRQDWHRRPAESADFDRYRRYLKAQVRELLTGYGPIDIMWFDGEWEPFWTHEHGQDLYSLVRHIQPPIIVNNRVDKGREGMAGLTRRGFAGDFGTPEQEVPATGIPGMAWETCMTMNDTWGYKKDDRNWKSAADLLRTLVDVASKGGNFLLNVGPTAEGEIPPASVERLREMGRWLRPNSESIFGTSASPFGLLAWGRCTQRRLEDGSTRLYLHVFQWPPDGRLEVPGIANRARGAFLLAGGSSDGLEVTRDEDALRIAVPPDAPDPVDTVVALDVEGSPEVCDPPLVRTAHERFVERTEVEFVSDRPGAVVRFTIDGTPPRADSVAAPRRLGVSETTVILARYFQGSRPISGARRLALTKVAPRPALDVPSARPGLRFAYHEADCNSVRDLAGTEPVETGIAPGLDITRHRRGDHFGFVFAGLLRVPADGMYAFELTSDDGALLRIGGEVVVDHDGLHAATAKTGHAALAAGLHEIEVLYFEKGGLEALALRVTRDDGTSVPLDATTLLHAE